MLRPAKKMAVDLIKAHGPVPVAGNRLHNYTVLIVPRIVQNVKIFAMFVIDLGACGGRRSCDTRAKDLMLLTSTHYKQ